MCFVAAYFWTRSTPITLSQADTHIYPPPHTPQHVRDADRSGGDGNGDVAVAGDVRVFDGKEQRAGSSDVSQDADTVLGTDDDRATVFACCADGMCVWRVQGVHPRGRHVHQHGRVVRKRRVVEVRGLPPLPPCLWLDHRHMRGIRLARRPLHPRRLLRRRVLAQVHRWGCRIRQQRVRLVAVWRLRRILVVVIVVVLVFGLVDRRCHCPLCRLQDLYLSL